MKRKRNNTKGEKDLIKKRKIFTEVFVDLDFVPTPKVRDSRIRKRKRKNFSKSENDDNHHMNLKSQKKKVIKKRKETCSLHMTNDGMIQLTEYKRINQYKYTKRKLVQEVEKDINKNIVLRVYSKTNAFLRALNYKRSRRNGNDVMDLDE